MQRPVNVFRAVVWAVGLISAALLGYEILLLRLFAIAQWHHFAYMIISIALLGFGASGSCIAIFRKPLLRRFDLFFRLFTLLFPCSLLLSYLLAQRIEFNPAELVWNPQQYWALLHYYLALFLPFFTAALALGLSFTRYTGRIGLLYASNLGGSGLGALGATLGLFLCHPVSLIYLALGVALAAGLLFLPVNRILSGGVFFAAKPPNSPPWRGNVVDLRKNSPPSPLSYEERGSTMNSRDAAVSSPSLSKRGGQGGSLPEEPSALKSTVLPWRGWGWGRTSRNPQACVPTPCPSQEGNDVSVPGRSTENPFLRAFAVRLLAFLLLGVLSGAAVRYDPLNLLEQLAISPYKGLSQARNFPEAAVMAEAHGPLGIVHALASPVIRHAPGLSLNYAGAVPSQIGLFIDAESAGAIVRLDGWGRDLSQERLQARPELEFFDFLPASLPYALRPAAKVLILGAGGGADVLNALSHGANSVDAVELNRDVIRIVRDVFHKESGGLYSAPQVELFQQEARAFAESARERYDLIQLSLLDAFGASTAGVHALNENYLYTIEALQQYYDRLAPGGILAITRWLKFPPRDNIKLFATALEALEESGEEQAASRLAAIRSWATHTLLVSNTPFSAEEIERLRDFCQERFFDPTYFPGIRADEANRFNQLPSAEFFHAMHALLSEEREAFYESYPYYIRPARDNSPYFAHFFRWKSFTTLWRRLGRDWIPFVEWGYLVLLATLAQAGLLSVLLILAPLWFLPRRSLRARQVLAATGFFGCLGLGYLFLEMVCIQKFTLFLADPVLTASVTIASFLIFSGLGSLTFESKPSGGTLFFGAVGGIALLCVGYTLFLPQLFAVCADWGRVAKAGLSILCIAPLGFCMGIPFPCGLKYLGKHAEPLVPWAYGVNGCASVLSSLIATGIAVSYGFQTVFLLAGVLYLGAAAIGGMVGRLLK